MYAYDINFAVSTVRVSHKPDRGWIPKAYKEREIPIPSKLAKSLRAWKVKADRNCSLVFPTAGCRPKLNFLDDLKAVAERAKLDPEDSGCTNSAQRSQRSACGRSRPSHRSTVARSLRYGVDHAVFEAVAESACAGQSERNLCLEVSFFKTTTKSTRPSSTTRSVVSVMVLTSLVQTSISAIDRRSGPDRVRYNSEKA
jgi:hypothetical protein